MNSELETGVISIFNSLIISWGYGGHVLGLRIWTEGSGQKDNLWPFSCGSEHVHTYTDGKEIAREKKEENEKSQSGKRAYGSSLH